MTSCIIKKVEPVPGLVPSLRYATTLRVDADLPHTRLFIAKWVGEVAFTTEPENGMSEPGPRKLVLPAHWASEPSGSRLLSTSEEQATFTCEMTTPILDSLERFRAGGR